MDIEKALHWADKLIHEKTGKHLNDLEREVFIGSYQGRTYEDIYPLNPQYVEKDVGYKLWQKLSNVLEEKVSKKNFRGALERSLKQRSLQVGKVSGSELGDSHRLQESTQRLFISHRAQEPDISLAAQFC